MSVVVWHELSSLIMFLFENITKEIGKNPIKEKWLVDKKLSIFFYKQNYNII